MTAKKTTARAGQALLDADAAVVDTVEPYRHAPPVEALSWYSELGDQPQMLGISGAVLAAGLFRRDARMARAGGRMIAAHLLATAAKNFVKHRVDRTRPRSAVVARNGHKPTTGRNRAKEETSFPSGHSAGAIAVARAFSREYPEYQGPALAAAGLIALAQIPRCAHYPTDVGAGLAVGLAAESAVDRLWPNADGTAASSKAAPRPA